MEDKTKTAPSNRSDDPSEAETADQYRTAEFPTLVGQLLDGRFQIEKDLTDTGADAGGIGKVYLARDMKLLGRQVVVKILQKEFLGNAEVVRKFHHEREALIRLDHPNIVRILDSGNLTDGDPFLVMEYISGHSLRKVLRERRQLPFDQAANIIEGVTSALAAAHSKNVLHRDIKPENIMLTPSEDGREHVRLIDFGIARVGESLLAPETTVGHGAGTLRYIAPEQLRGNLDQTGAVDIYSFSAVIYEMLTGELPFKLSAKYQTEAIVEMYELQKAGVAIRPSSLRAEIPHAAERLLLSGLEYEPANRPANARAYGRELASALLSAAGATMPTAENIPVSEATYPSAQPSVVTVENRRQPEQRFASDLSAINVPVVPRRSGKKIWLIGAVAALVLAALAIPAGIAYWNAGEPAANTNSTKASTNSNSQAATSVGPARQISYFLNVQKMRDGKPYEEPFKSSGQEIFESGYKFTLAFEPEDDGYVYMFNEGKDEAGVVRYYLLFPSPSVNGGSSAVKSKTQYETFSNTFSGGRGTELMWLIWTKDKDQELDRIVSSIKTKPAEVAGPDAAALNSFIEKHTADKPEVSKNSADQKMVVKAKGDVIVHRFELEHR